VNSLRVFTHSALIALFALPLASDDNSSLRVRVISAAPPRIAGALTSQKCFQLTRGNHIEAQFWFRAATPRTAAATPAADRERVNFSLIGDGSLFGIVKLSVPWRDYRGRTVAAGTYLLRYRIQPRLKDHAGTTRYRDFLVLEPGLPNSHPFVMALVPPTSPTPTPRVRLDDRGDVILEMRTSGIQIGLVFAGIGDLGL
jgi:hypothetical protein